MLVRLLVVLAIVAAVALFGAWRRARGGRLRTPGDGWFSADQLADVGLATVPRGGAALLLGSPGCAPCTTVRAILAEVAATRPAFDWVHVDAADHMALVDAHRVMRVPTLFLVDREGRILARTSGVPARRDLERVLDRGVDSLDPATPG